MQPVSDGNSYGEAAQKGQEALEYIIEFYQAEGWSLPQHKTLQNV
jgi:antitoxin HicB